MKKPNKPTVKSVTAAFLAYKMEAQKFMYTLQFPAQRKLLSVDAADAQGRLNGMTIVELITVVQLSANQGEKVVISVQDKTITLTAEPIAKQAPFSLL